jgi:hypothetical protein
MIASASQVLTIAFFDIHSRSELKSMFDIAAAVIFQRTINK